MENESSEKLYNVISKSGSSKTTLNYSLCYALPTTYRSVVQRTGQLMICCLD